MPEIKVTTMNGFYRGKPIDYNNPVMCQEIIEYLLAELNSMRMQHSADLDFLLGRGEVNSVIKEND